MNAIWLLRSELFSASSYDDKLLSLIFDSADGNQNKDHVDHSRLCRCHIVTIDNLDMERVRICD